MPHPITDAVEVKGSMKVTQKHWDAIFNKGKPKIKQVITVKCYDCGSPMHKVDQDMFYDTQWKCEYCGATRLTNEDGEEQ